MLDLVDGVNLVGQAIFDGTEALTRLQLDSSNGWTTDTTFWIAELEVQWTIYPDLLRSFQLHLLTTNGSQLDVTYGVRLVQVHHVTVTTLVQHDLLAQVGSEDRIVERGVTIHLVSPGHVVATCFQCFSQGYQHQLTGVEVVLDEHRVLLVLLVQLFELGEVCRVERVVQVRSSEAVELEQLTFLTSESSYELGQGDRVVDTTDLFLCYRHRVLQGQHGFVFWIEDLPGQGVSTATTVLQVGFYHGFGSTHVRQLALVLDHTATNSIAQRTGVQVSTTTRRHVGHGVSDVQTDADRGSGVFVAVDAARSETTQRCTQVHEVRSRGVDTTVAQMLIELDGVIHAAIFRLLFRQSHCHTHVNELRRLEDVTLSTEAVLQGVLLIDVLTAEMWVGLVFLVGNDLLQFSVLCFGIVEQIHVAHLGEFEVQLTDGWYTLRECTFGDQRGIQLTCHQVVSPGFTT
ncbi:hypothetical protein D3C73_874570 [compost metagenome]